MRAVFLLLLVPVLAVGHPGGLDRHGGHNDRRSGEYHCHSDSCRAAQQQQHQAEQEAERQGRQFSTLYDRRDWPHWDDEDGNCRDTRAEILIATSRIEVTFREPQGCTVDSGEWLDPYSGQIFYRAAQLDVDHLVPLKHAHGHGGHSWPTAKRRQFANDPANLVPVSAGLNRAKGSSSPDQWLPPNRAHWCEYGRRWQDVKRHYQLMITPPEQQIVEQLLQTCPVLSVVP